MRSRCFPGKYPTGTGARTCKASKAVETAVYRRDHYTCVYCGRRTVHNDVLRQISALLPAEFPWQRNWQRAVTHRFYYDLSTSLDHIEAVSAGGDPRAEANCATACWRCNRQKGNRSLVSLGLADPPRDLLVGRTDRPATRALGPRQLLALVARLELAALICREPPRPAYAADVAPVRTLVSS